MLAEIGMIIFHRGVAVETLLTEIFKGLLTAVAINHLTKRCDHCRCENCGYVRCTS